VLGAESLVAAEEPRPEHFFSPVATLLGTHIPSVANHLEPILHDVGSMPWGVHPALMCVWSSLVQIRRQVVGHILPAASHGAALTPRIKAIMAHIVSPVQQLTSHFALL
jgi:hypothetical protein